MKSSYATAPVRWLMFVLAWLCVVLGMIGLVTPLMPGTVFLILAAWLFSRSSPRFESWLLGHPRLGPAVVAWRENGTLPRWVPYVATASLAVSFTVLIVLHLSVPILMLIGAFFVGLSIYLWTRPVA